MNIGSNGYLPPPPPARPPPPNHPVHPDFVKRCITPDDFGLPPSTRDGRPLTKDRVQAALGFEVLSFELVAQAFTHMSGVLPGGESYERLEFVGDAVLDFIVTKYLFDAFPGAQEGFLTRVRTKLVSGKFLSVLAWRLGFQDLVVMNQEALTKGWNSNPRILEDVFEAVVGALYLGMGLVAARDFVLAVIERFATLDDVLEDTNHKDRLARHMRAQGVTVPVAYHADECAGADPWFEVRVSVGDRVLGRAGSRSKKDAEQAAARAALQAMGIRGEAIQHTGGREARRRKKV